MFVLKCLFRCTQTLDKFSVSLRHVRDEKSKFIKELNYENKYLYGKLLETRKQRRKSIAKLKKELEESEGSVFNEISDITKKKIKRKVKEKPLSQIADDKHLKALMIEENQKQQSSKEDLPNKEKNASPPLSEKSSSKTDVLISEKIYPLENPSKPVTKELSVENVINYSFNDPLVKQYAHLPSVSKIIEETMSENNKLILNKWKQRMIKRLGEEGFNKYSTDIKAQGQEFHEAVRNTVLGETPQSPTPVVSKALQSLSWVLEQVSQPMAVESMLAHPQLGYKGIPDCVAMFRDIPVVIDWKLSEKPKRDIKDTYEAPVQVTAYIGALNHDPNYKCAVNHGLIAVAYHSGDPCDVFLLSPKYCHIYWRHWLLRFDKFKTRNHLHLDHEIDEKILELE